MNDEYPTLEWLYLMLYTYVDAEMRYRWTHAYPSFQYVEDETLRGIIGARQEYEQQIRRRLEEIRAKASGPYNAEPPR